MAARTVHQTLSQQHSGPNERPKTSRRSTSFGSRLKEMKCLERCNQLRFPPFCTRSTDNIEDLFANGCSKKESSTVLVLVTQQDVFNYVGVWSYPAIR